MHFKQIFRKLATEFLSGLKITLFGFSFYFLPSYESKGSFAVTFNNISSRPLVATLGVPHGSPLLIILCKTYIHFCLLKYKFLLYAEELRIYLVIQNSNDFNAHQVELDKLQSFCLRNHFLLKAESAIVFLHVVTLPRCFSFRFRKFMILVSISI